MLSLKHLACRFVTIVLSCLFIGLSAGSAYADWLSCEAVSSGFRVVISGKPAQIEGGVAISNQAGKQLDRKSLAGSPGVGFSTGETGYRGDDATKIPVSLLFDVTETQPMTGIIVGRDYEQSKLWAHRFRIWMRPGARTKMEIDGDNFGALFCK